MSVNNVSPQTFLGGTWQAWGAGKVPVGVDPNDTDFNASNKSGGSKTVTLTLEQIPSHKHPIPYRTDTNITGGSSGQWTTDPGTSSGSSDSKAIAVGGGKAHQNMPPYLTAYMWRRVS